MKQTAVKKAPAVRKKATPKVKAEPVVIPTWLTVVRAAESRKATEIKVLDLTGITAFTDYFIICSGSNSRQLQAIADEVRMQMKKRGELPYSIEGYNQAEWVLCDYGDMVVHILSEKARAYYGLERLWSEAKPVAIPQE